jgi:hypothetical protein
LGQIQQFVKKGIRDRNCPSAHEGEIRLRLSPSKVHEKSGCVTRYLEFTYLASD